MCASDGFISMLGAQSIDEILGKTDHDFTPAYLADSFRKDDLQVMQTGETLQSRVELVPNNDAVPDWRVTTKIPVFGKDGTIIGVAGITRALRQARAIYGPHADLAPVLDHIRNSFAESISVKELASIGNISVSTLERRFKALFGTTPLQYLRKVRINAASQALKTTNNPIATIALDCGFADQSSLTRQFKEFLHIAPHAYRNQFSDGSKN